MSPRPLTSSCQALLERFGHTCRKWPDLFVVRVNGRHPADPIARSIEMARYMLSVHTVDGEARPHMTKEEMQASRTQVLAFQEEMKSAGAWVFGGALHGPDTATVVHAVKGEVLTTDGPFAESKEHIGGLYIIKADDLDAALSWAARTSALINKPIEVRPFREETTD